MRYKVQLEASSDSDALQMDDGQILEFTKARTSQTNGKANLKTLPPRLVPLSKSFLLRPSQVCPIKTRDLFRMLNLNDTAILCAHKFEAHRLPCCLQGLLGSVCKWSGWHKVARFWFLGAAPTSEMYP